MRTSFVFSCVLHAAIVAVSYYGLPALRKPPAPMQDVPILVEVVTVAEQTNVPAPQPEPEPEPEPEPPPPPPEPEPPPPPPEPAALPEPPPPEPEPEPDIAAVPPPEPKPEPKPKPKPEPEAKPKPPEKLASAKPRRKPKPPDTFASVLKTVEALKKDAPRPAPVEDPQPKPDSSFDVDQIAEVLRGAQRFNASLPLTISEIDLVRQRIAQCWSLPSGAREAENLIIEIRTVMNPDGSVREAQIRDQIRMRTDPFFRAAAESALRAVLNPRCNPLPLPPEKYEQWKTMTLTFNPKEMFGA